MKIKVRLSDAGLRDAERQIQEYKTTLNKKAQEFAKALSSLALVLYTLLMSANFLTALANTERTEKAMDSISAGTTTANLVMLARLSSKLMEKVS